MDNQILEAAAAALAALDFSAANRRIAELNADIAAMGAASDKANARCIEIELARRENRGPDAAAVADALLAELEPIEAARVGPDRQEMEAERTSLLSGMRELRHRIEDAQSEVGDIKNAAAAEVMRVAGPLVEAVMADARQNAEALVQSFATMEAIRRATRGYSNEASVVATAIEGCIGDRKLLGWRATAEVPAAIQQTLKSLTEKGPAHPAGLMTTAYLRDHI